MRRLRKLALDENGAAMADWVSLVSALLLLGLVVVYSVYNVGVASVALQVESALDDVRVAADVGAAPNLASLPTPAVGRPAVLSTDSLAAGARVGPIRAGTPGRIGLTDEQQ